ncbi:MAG: hypothetical protein J7559_06330, partial [Cohnella sp.]|nr:hypothetical protein [Cohnella sp.]
MFNHSHELIDLIDRTSPARIIGSAPAVFLTPFAEYTPLLHIHLLQRVLELPEAEYAERNENVQNRG